MSEKNQGVVGTVPDDCPAGYNDIPNANLSEEAMLDVGVNLENHWGMLPEAVSRAESPAALKIVSGQLACRLCDYKDECAQAVKLGQDASLVENSHPLELEGVLKPEEKAQLWANAAVRAKEAEGYSFQSVANMAGEVSRLPKPLMDVVVEMLKVDGESSAESSSMPEQIGSLTIEGKDYSVITWSGSRLIVSKTVVEAIQGEHKKGNVYGSYRTLIGSLSSMLRSSAMDASRSYLSEFLSSGGDLRQLNIKKLHDIGVLEFNASTHSMVRIFGDVFESPRSLTRGDEDRITTVFLPGVSTMSKSGGGGQINRSAKEQEVLVKRLKSLCRTGNPEEMLKDINLKKLVSKD